MPTNNVLIDDRLLVAHLLDAPVALPRRAAIHTTACWYYRACRAAIAKGTGQLSGPFRGLPREQQALAIQALVLLPDHIGLPDARSIVPEMAAVATRHAPLNLLNVEAIAAARLLDAHVLLSPLAAKGVLPEALAIEGIAWEVVPARA